MTAAEFMRWNPHFDEAAARVRIAAAKAKVARLDPDDVRTQIVDQAARLKHGVKLCSVRYQLRCLSGMPLGRFRD